MAYTPGLEQQATVQVNSEGFEQFTGNMNNAVDGLLNFRQAVGVAGAALAALGTGAMAASIDAAREFEDAMVEVEKVTNPETADEMADSVQNMAESIPLAQEELAGLTADAARFGIEGTENIENFTETVARMATATDLTTDEAGESLAKLAELTGTPIDEIENLGSAINTMGNEFATAQSEVVDSMMRSSAALSQLGLSQTEMAGVSAALNEVSASSRRAGSRMRRLSQEMMDPNQSQALAEAMGLTNAEFKNMRDEDPSGLIRDMAESFAEGGEQAENLRGALTSQSQQAVAGLAQNLDGLDEAMARSNESFEEGESLQEEFDAQMDTTSSQIQLLRNRINNIAIDMGEVFLPYVNDLLGAFNGILDPLQSFNEETEGVAGAVTAATAAVGGLAIAVGAFVSGPLGIAIAALAALGAAYKTNVLGFGDAVDEAFSLARDAIDAAMPSMEQVESAFETLEAVAGRWQTEVGKNVELVRGHFGEFRETVAPAVETVKDNLALVGEGLSVVLDAFTSSSGDISSFADTYIETSRSVLDTTLSVVNSLVGVWVDAFVFLSESFLQPTMERVISVYETHLSDLVSETAETAEVVVERFKWFAGVVRPVIDALVSAALGAWRLFGDEILAVAEFAFDAVSGFITTALDGVLTTIRVVLALIRGDWGEAWDLITGFAERSLSGLVEFVSGWGERLLGYLLGVGDDILGFAQDTATAIYEWFEGGVEDATRAVESGFDALAFWLSGEWSARLYTEANSTLDDLRGWFEDTIDGIEQYFHNVFGDIITFIVEWADEFVESITDLGDRVGDSLREAINDAMGLPFSHTIGEVEVGGETVFSGATIEIPGLAEGGIVEGPTIAALAEHGDPEVVAPLDKFEQMASNYGGAAQAGAVRVVFEGNDALVQLVEEHAEVVVDNEFDRRRRRSKRLGERGDV